MAKILLVEDNEMNRDMLSRRLTRRGYDVGEPDGQLGGRTRAAIRDFQSRIGQVPDGFASAVVLERLRAR